MTKANEPTVKREQYADKARLQKTPDRAPGTVTRTYTVVSKKTVHGMTLGESGELTLTFGEEAALIQAGHLVPVENGQNAAESKEGV